MNIYASYFSATNRTKIVVERIATQVAEKAHTKIMVRDFTLPKARKTSLLFGANDFVVMGLPVYAGRLPNLMLKYLETLEGHGAKAVAVVTYGNRQYDDALIELAECLECQGFDVIAAGAFIGEHSFSKILGKDRPDAQDLAKIETFSREIIQKMETGKMTDFQIKGQWPSKGYFKPQDRHGNLIDIRKVKPITSDACTQCGLCAAVCPMEAIDFEDYSNIKGVCIKCGACVKKCSVGAKFFDDPGYIYHMTELEEVWTRRAEPEWFL